MAVGSLNAFSCASSGFFLMLPMNINVYLPISPPRGFLLQGLEVLVWWLPMNISFEYRLGSNQGFRVFLAGFWRWRQLMLDLDGQGQGQVWTFGVGLRKCLYGLCLSRCFGLRHWIFLGFVTLNFFFHLTFGWISLHLFFDFIYNLSIFF